MTNILVVDDEEAIRNSFSMLLANDDFKVDVAVGINDAKTFISMNEFDVAVIDRILANGQSGIELARYINHIQPDCETIIMSAFPTFKSASESLQLNTFCYLTKPVKHEDLRTIVRNAVENGRKKKEGKRCAAAMQLLYENTPSGIMVCDSTCNVISINPSFTRILGYEKNEVVGYRMEGLPFWTDAKDDDEMVRQIKRTPGKLWEVKRKTKDNRDIDLILSQSIYDDDKEGSGCILVMFQDVTEYRHMEQYLEKTQKMESLGNIARLMAHDMSNIIMVILSYSDLLMTELSRQSEFQKHLKEIVKASERADRILKQILMMSKETTGEKKSIKSAPFLRDVLHRAVLKMGDNITVKQQINEDCNDIIGDKDLLFRMMMNIILNAVQSIGENKGVIEVTMESVTFKKRTSIHSTTLKKGAYTVITVKDTGTGMDEMTHAQMFEPFFTTHKDQQRSGVGLTIVREIVRKHKGTITVKSETGNGTSISVYLPIREYKEYITKNNKEEVII